MLHLAGWLPTTLLKRVVVVHFRCARVTFKVLSFAVPCNCALPNVGHPISDMAFAQFKVPNAARMTSDAHAKRRVPKARLPTPRCEACKHARKSLGCTITAACWLLFHSSPCWPAAIDALHGLKELRGGLQLQLSRAH